MSAVYLATVIVLFPLVIQSNFNRIVMLTLTTSCFYLATLIIGVFSLAVLISFLLPAVLICKQMLRQGSQV